MRARSHLTADEWARRLDELMAAVLAAPERYHPSLGHWARWRARWLAECAEGKGGSNLYHLAPQTAARAEFLCGPADLMPRPHPGKDK
jgi:hypothetical protein